jgi:hypothetical protein
MDTCLKLVIQKIVNGTVSLHKIFALKVFRHNCNSNIVGVNQLYVSKVKMGSTVLYYSPKMRLSIGVALHGLMVGMEVRLVNNV